MVEKSRKHPELTHKAEDNAKEDNRHRKREPTHNNTTQQRTETQVNYHTNATPRFKDRDSVGAGGNKSRIGGLCEIPVEDPPRHITKRQQEKRNTTGESSRKQSKEGGRAHSKAESCKREADVKPQESQARKTKQPLRKGTSCDHHRVKSDGGIVSAESPPEASSAGKKQPTGHLQKPAALGHHGAGSTAQKSSAQNSTRGRHNEGESKAAKKPHKAAHNAVQEAPRRSVISQTRASDMDDFREVAEDLKERLQDFFKDMYIPKDGAGAITPEMQSTLDKICFHTTDAMTAANQILYSMPGSDVAEADVDGLARQVEHARLEAASAEEKLLNLLEKNSKPKKAAKKK